MEQAVFNCEIGAAQGNLPRRFTLLNAGKCAQIGEADAHGGMFHREQSLISVIMAMFGDDGDAGVIEHFDPARDEAAFSGLGILEILEQSRATPPALAVPHHHNLAHFQLRDRKFQCSRNAVPPATQFEWWHQIGDVADDKHFARRRIKNG